MPNTTSIDTETLVSRIPMDEAGPLDQRIKMDADAKGFAGYQLAATFVIGAQLVLIYQRTR